MSNEAIDNYSKDEGKSAGKKEQNADNKTDDKKNQNPFQNKPKKPKGPNFYWIYGLIVIALLAATFWNKTETLKEVSWNEVEQFLIKNQIEKFLVINKEYTEIYIKKDSLKNPIFNEVSKGYNETPNPGPHYKFKFGDYQIFNQDIKNTVSQIVESQGDSLSVVVKRELTSKYTPKIDFEARKDWSGEIFNWLLFIGLIVLFWVFILRRMGGGPGGGGQIFNIGKSKAQLFDKDTTVQTTFKDVAGLEEAKVEIMEIVDFLKNPKKYTTLGGKIPKGALLVGPPGTGKTLLAKAVAGEAKVPFFSISGSDFVEMFVGVGASRVRDLFRTAKEKAPCIIFIDEIDAIGRARGKNAVTGANDERENTLNQLLTEMDGFSTNSGVIILAATNRADILDRALMRAGRFDRQIHVELPDVKEREEIFKVHMKPLKLDDSVNVEFLAKQTPGFSGADIANVCNESALIAARGEKQVIEKQDFMNAIDRIIGGLEKRNKIISMEEKRVIAFHEAGHASISWLLEHANPLVKVTIIPRGKSLGAAWYLPEERQITTFDQMYDELTAALGGRASEDVMFGRVSTGALNDLEKVTKQAYAMVVYFGLNKEIGNISYYDSSGQSEYSFTKPYSEKTAEIIDTEISKIIESAYIKAKHILTENKPKLEQLAQVLLDKEVIFKEDVEHIFGPRKWISPHHDLAENGDKKPEVKAENNEAATPETG